MTKTSTRSKLIPDPEVAEPPRRRTFSGEYEAQILAACDLAPEPGALGAHLVGDWTGWAMVVRPETVLLAVGFSGAVGVFFGGYPAWRASRLDVIEALRFA